MSTASVARRLLGRVFHCSVSLVGGVGELVDAISLERIVGSGVLLLGWEWSLLMKMMRYGLVVYLLMLLGGALPSGVVVEGGEIDEVSEVVVVEDVVLR
ncbi:hypothetical protein JD969_11515 [Planctomycetota bacterium]|nr:hypothetical protein JD969_11515 [Planctomycetota bacterium]